MSSSTDTALSQLLAALANGVRAVQGLPLKDDFAFQSSFREFTDSLSVTRTSLLETLTQALESLPEGTLSDTVEDLKLFHDIEDPLFWETCADAVEALMEKVEDANTVSNLQQFSQESRVRAQSAFGRMMEGLVDIEKPQVTYKFVVQNSRTEPFVPRMIESKPFAVTPLDLSLQPGHGLETRFGELRGGGKTLLPTNLVAPTAHVPHVYADEIRAFSYTDKQLEIPSQATSNKIPIVNPLQATWVDSPEALQELATKLETVDEIAVDLEAHSYRSFAGFCCLMQLSIRKNDDNMMDNYLIDTLKLHHCLNQYLQPAFANPEIVKVMHGADSDIPWLQRDFGLYIVNLFDTGRAARALHLSSASYAHLLSKYVGITADKSFQLGDWRQRPLPNEMLQYAIQDTHYLLDISGKLKCDLKTSDMIEKVLDISRQVCLIRYAVEPFNPDGYKIIARRKSSSRQRTELNDVQERILESLWDWRDRVARKEDESLAFVCENSALLRIALAAQTTTSVSSLQALFNPMPPLLLKYAQDVISLVKVEVNRQVSEDAANDEEVEEFSKPPVGAPSSAFFKPTPGKDQAIRRGMMSPVLGTEALYEQAGWTTPTGGKSKARPLIVDVASSTGDEDDATAGDKPRRLLSINEANKNFRSKQHSGHSIELGGDASRSRSVDGMRTVQVARENSQSPIARTVEDEAKMAKDAASRIRTTMSQKDALPAMLNLISPTIDVEDDDGDDARGDLNKADGGDTDEEEFAVPRSMQEIYKISNKNRRFKKTGSPTPERGVTPTSEKEREELAKAEALLKEKGLLDSIYFVDPAGSPGKRPRTKSATGRDSEESVPQDAAMLESREEDIATMKAVGWMPDGADASGAAGRPGTYGYDYSTVGSIGALDPSQSANPFFAGAALTGGPLAQGFGKTEQMSRRARKTVNKEKHNRRQERPEKKDGRTHSYRSSGNTSASKR